MRHVMAQKSDEVRNCLVSVPDMVWTVCSVRWRLRSGIPIRLTKEVVM